MPDHNTADIGGSSEEILAKTIDALRQDEATDISLLEILTKHILTSSPVSDAVDVAVKDIETLAVGRAQKVD
jgi:hypothetical protein